MKKEFLLLILFVFISGCITPQTPEEIVEKDNIPLSDKILEQMQEVDGNSTKRDVGTLKTLDELEIEEKNKVFEEYKSTFGNELNIESWAYQLKNYTYADLRSANVDLLVIDYEESHLTRGLIEELREEKYVVSYLNIGEAEDYRSYWNYTWKIGEQKFLDEENPEKIGHYRVEFWNESWKGIVFKRIDRIINLGYDGVYLDGIATYEFYENRYSDVQDEMIKFVYEIFAYARAKDEDFIIIAQNSPELIQFSAYRSFIDGLGKEDTFYDDNFDISHKTWAKEDLEHTREWLRQGKIVLVIDYVTRENLKPIFEEKARSEGFIPFVSTRELDNLDYLENE